MFDFSPYHQWLDFAGGSGSYALAACERYSHLRVLVLDQPNVIPVTREFVAQHNLEDRIEIGVGDFLGRSSYPSDCDLISFIMPLQGYMPDDLHRVFTYTFKALPSGGDDPHRRLHAQRRQERAARSGFSKPRWHPRWPL